MLLTTSWILDFGILSTIILLLFYKYFTRHFDYWRKQGVYCPKPVPFLGNFYDVFAFKTTIQEQIKVYYDQTAAPFFGIFILDDPALVLKSPKLIKDVLIKDFSVFCDRRVATPKHPNLTHGIFFLNKYLPWKKIRAKLSPLFTSGMIKTMHARIEIINQLTTDFLYKNTGVLDVRIVAGHFSTEMIVRNFYGADAHCFDRETSMFRKYIHKLFDFNFRNAVIQNLYYLKPSLVSMLPVIPMDYIEKDAINFFDGAFKDAVAARAMSNGKPQDFIDLMKKSITEKQDENSDVLDMNMAVSNAILFLIAGQETTSTIIAFTLYELAMNQEIQDRLREEMRSNVKQYGGLTFEGIQDNKYLDMCLKETMRKYTALPFLDRVPIKDYRFEGTDLVVKKGTSVLIPIFSLHRDEKFYPNAERYDPERFSGAELNSDGLNFIPFGEGPRACIGKRLGIIAVSMALSNILLKFKVEKCDKTPEKIEFDPKNFALVSKVGLPLRVTPVEVPL